MYQTNEQIQSYLCCRHAGWLHGASVETDRGDHGFNVAEAALARFFLSWELTAALV